MNHELQRQSNNFHCALPDIRFHITSRLSTVEINLTVIKAIITRINVKKAHGPDLISANMVKLWGETLCFPFKIIFENILDTGIPNY